MTVTHPASDAANLDPVVDATHRTGWRRWLTDLGQNEQGRVAQFGAIVVGGFLGAVALLYIFAWLANEVLEQETLALDMAVLTYLQSFSSPQLTATANFISLLGSQVVFVLAVVMLGVFMWQRRWGAASVLIIVTAGAQVLNDVLKALFHRARPMAVTGLLDPQQFSFPSGHAMIAAAFYLYLAYLAWRLVHGWSRGVLAGGLIVLVLLIGLARLYLEAHYLSDVIAGYVAGILWTDAVIVGSRVLSVRRKHHHAVRVLPHNAPIPSR